MEKIMKLFKGDRVIWIMVIFLIFISLLAVYSSSESYANTVKKYGGNNGFLLLKHSLMLLIGFVTMVVASCLNYRRYSWILPFLLVISVPLLAYTSFAGQEVNDASRSIRIGSVSFQTSDLAKIALIGYLARVLALEHDDLNTFWKVGLKVMMPVAIVVGLIFKDNLSTAAMLFVVCLVVMFVSRLKFKYILEFVGIVLAVGALVIFIGYKIQISNPATSKGRFVTWVNRIERFVSKKEVNENDDGYFQIMHSKIAVAQGGIIGKSPGKSTQRNILPHSSSDFIYAIIVEEYGLAGGIVVMLIYMILLFRVTRIVIRAPQSFGALLSIGLAFNIVMQAMVNMGVAVGLLPVTGQPLPFVSMGGTSMMFTGMSLGIIISVTKDINNNHEREAELEKAEADS